MILGNTLTFDETTVFRNMRKGHLTFTEVYDDIIGFIKTDINCSYKISIGTDSQVGTKTAFVTCIHVHRIGKGAIGYLHKDEMTRPVKNLREKIYLETCASLQLAYMFEGERTKKIYDILGKKVTFEFHLDIGTKGKTRTLINEMTGMVQGIGFVPKIKPESYCASCFADRYTKAI